MTVGYRQFFWKNVFRKFRKDISRILLKELICQKKSDVKCTSNESYPLTGYPSPLGMCNTLIAFFSEELDPPPNECPDMTLNNLMVRLL